MVEVPGPQARLFGAAGITHIERLVCMQRSVWTQVDFAPKLHDIFSELLHEGEG